MGLCEAFVMVSGTQQVLDVHCFLSSKRGIDFREVGLTFVR